MLKNSPRVFANHSLRLHTAAGFSPWVLSTPQEKHWTTWGGFIKDGGRGRARPVLFKVSTRLSPILDLIGQCRDSKQIQKMLFIGTQAAKSKLSI